MDDPCSIVFLSLSETSPNLPLRTGPGSSCPPSTFRALGGYDLSMSSVSDGRSVLISASMVPRSRAVGRMSYKPSSRRLFTVWRPMSLVPS